MNPSPTLTSAALVIIEDIPDTPQWRKAFRILKAAKDYDGDVDLFAAKVIAAAYRKREDLVRMNALLQVQLTAALKAVAVEHREKIREIAA